MKGPAIWNLAPDRLKQLVHIYAFKKEMKNGSRKTAHVGYVKLTYHMLVLFEVVSLYLFLKTHSGAVHQKLSYEGPFLREDSPT